ncbi:nucleotide exchange factor GrpE [Hanstruepera neustonica]|uniref:Protein GrpE n=1 Tax=Hanstruepera neustonica TaxID=1445657 RepID=A0A2K1DZC7_9FLAO|nr:nucleotide exchange factor GrpE [Hanstruepera neustonica]PNQ73354.1 nucleotide exchange factor GrpE [Hanstruepera neustonica]
MSKKDNKEVESSEQVEEQVLQKDESTVEEKLTESLEQEKDKFLRLFAEFENYKRRTAKERIDLFKTASEDVMLAMLPVLDDFERALTHIEEDKEAEELRKGVLLIYQKLMNTLEQKGLKPLTVTSGDDFNADVHEAITQIPAPTDDLKGKIIDVVEKGYQLGDKIIRFPKVVIGQ